MAGVIMLLAVLSSYVRSEHTVSLGTFAYEARMGPLIAGELLFDFQRRHDTGYAFWASFGKPRVALAPITLGPAPLTATGLWPDNKPQDAKPTWC